MSRILAIPDKRAKERAAREPLKPVKRAYDAAYRTDNKEILKTKAAARYEANAAVVKERVRAYRVRNKERYKIADRNKHYVRKFGITLAAYNAMLDTHRGMCALCEQAESMHSRGGPVGGNLAVDHDHTTGRIRGLLCFKCNTALAQFEKYNLFDRAVAYV